MKKVRFIGSSILTTVLLFTLTLVPMRQVVPVALAGGPTGVATSVNQMLDAAEQRLQTMWATISAGNTGLTAAGVTQLATKEIVDGIAWSIAKNMVSQMTQSMINWINSGFQGDPAFITDLNGMLLNALDDVAGEYIQSLGGFGEFICSPFKLDVQAALSINYAQARSGMPSGPNACSLSDIGANIENFLAGATSDWGEWAQVTSNPQNVPYGAYLEAEAKLNIRLVNEAGQELEVANWGDGFLSKKVCEGIEGKPADKGKNCKITTPGEVISKALTFQLSTGPQALIEADEINEIIGALINQIALQAMQGINGLLGLGGNSDYTDYSYGSGSTTVSYIDAAAAESIALNTDAIETQMSDSLLLEQSFAALATTTLEDIAYREAVIGNSAAALATIFDGPNDTADLLNLSPDSTLDQARDRISDAQRNGESSSQIATAEDELDELEATLNVIASLSSNADLVNQVPYTSFDQFADGGTASLAKLATLRTTVLSTQPQTAENIIALGELIADFDAASTTATASTSAVTIQQTVYLDYISLANTGNLTTSVELETKRIEWNGTLELAF